MSNWTDALDELDTEIADFYGVTAGTARKSITIQQVTRTRTKNGEFTEAWATFATVDDVLITEMRMEETDGNAERIEAVAQVEFDMPYTAGVVADMRISYDGKYYPIFGVTVDETQAYRTIAMTRRDEAPEKQP